MVFKGWITFGWFGAVLYKMCVYTTEYVQYSIQAEIIFLFANMFTVYVLCAVYCTWYRLQDSPILTNGTNA